MHNPLAFAKLGISLSERKRRFRESSIKGVETSRLLGLPTRIPFLKKELCHQDIPDIILSRHSSTIPLGSSFVLKFDLTKTTLKILLYPRLAVVEVVNFNSSRYLEGVQLVPCKRAVGELSREEQRKCETQLIGDLKISRILDNDKNIAVRGACYIDHNFQIFIGNDMASSRIEEVLTHEKEHAVHLSLWGLAGFHHRLFPVSIREYLAMLKTFIEFGHTGIIEYSRLGLFKNIRNKCQRPYTIASGIFMGKLLSVYKLKLNQTDLAFLPEFHPEKCTSKDLEIIDRMRECAMKEYKLTYEKLFGLSLDDIKEIIDSLPTI